MLALLVLAWTWPITQRMIADGDFPEHLAVATSIVEHPSVPAPHFLFFGSVALLMMAAPVTAQAAGEIVISLLHVGAALFILWYLRQASGRVSPATMALALGLLIVGPILPIPLEQSVALVGYFPPNPYHNATYTTAKPFCLWLLVVAAAALRGERRSIAAALAAVTLTAVSKPNYLTCLVPALGIGALARTARRRPVRWASVLAISTLATLIVLVMQWLYAGNNVAVIVAPFAALSFHTPIGPGLVWQLLGAVAFPAVVVLCWPRLLIERQDLSLAWGAAAVAFAEGYLLAEAAPRTDHGNLLVAASQGVFVLMVASAVALASIPAARSAWRTRLAWGVFALHLASGLRHVSWKLDAVDWARPLTAVALVATGVWVWRTTGKAPGSSPGLPAPASRLESPSFDEQRRNRRPLQKDAGGRSCH
jgi:hypothetical protein